MAARTRTKPELQQCSIVLRGEKIGYCLRRSARARRLRLEVRPETGLIAVMPRRYDARQIEAFIRDKTDWVLKTLANCQRAATPKSREALKSGDLAPYLGKDLRITVQLSMDGSSATLRRDDLLVSLGAGETAGGVLENWYRARAAAYCQKRATELSQKLELPFRRIIIRGQKTRWGSCSRKGTLSFNWRLIMSPRPVIDYVILHEIMHLKELNHGKRFWAHMSAHCPDWRVHRKWLKDHGPQLASALPDETPQAKM